MMMVGNCTQKTIYKNYLQKKEINKNFKYYHPLSASHFSFPTSLSEIEK